MILDRLRETIELISPENDIFTANWSGNERTVERKVGLFNFPKVKGTKGQDLEVNGDVYPLTFYFDGPNHDLLADQFWKAWHLRGKWGITHPLYGQLILQPVGTLTQDIQPVKNTMRTVFESQWIETLPDGSEKSLAVLQGQLEAQSILANISAASQFINNVKTVTYGQIKAVASSVNKVVSSVKKNIRIAQNFSLVPDEIETLIRGINSTISSASSLDTTVLARQTQQLIQIGVLAQETAQTALDTYNQLIGATTDVSTTGSDQEAVNIAATRELTLSAALVAAAQSALLPGIKTRMQAIETAEGMLSFFNGIQATLDDLQELFADSPIELQYYSQSESYYDNKKLISLAANYLLVSALDLAVEKRFKLKVPRNFVEICASELGAVDPDTLQSFIELNNLTLLEIRCIQTGREISVFV